MPLSIGVNLRVTGHCNQGGRKYMEDMFSVAFQSTPDDKDLEYAFFGIFDGHGGSEAATFAKEHLMNVIVKQKNFWSDRDEDVLRAIKDGYVNTHYAMWRELGKKFSFVISPRCFHRFRPFPAKSHRFIDIFIEKRDTLGIFCRISLIVPRISPTTCARLG